MMSAFSRLRALLVTGALSLGAATAVAQTNIEQFGQNRIQHRKFDWRFFDTEHFRIYHYDVSGRTLARYVAEQAERDISAVEKKLGGQFPRRFNIVLYNHYDEYRQTNVGRQWDSQLQDIPAGTVNVVGDRLVVYFNGVHTDLHRQLRSGMSRVVMQRMLFGDSFREVVKNAVLLNLPQWTVDGFIAFLVDGWDTDADTRWKALLAAKPGAGFYTLSEAQPELAGKAFWKWISDTRGDNDVKMLLYAMQSRGSLTKGIRSVTGWKVRAAYDSCLSFYRNTYSADSLRQEAPEASTMLTQVPVPNDNTVIRNLRVSPRGGYVAYVTWKEGVYHVYIQNTGGNRTRSEILTGGRQDYNETGPDPDYPLLTWSNDGYKLAIMYRKGLENRLRIYNSQRARVENYVVPGNRFDRVLSMTFVEDDTRLVFSAIRKSQTDLYEFRIKGSKLTAITNDVWDDIQPWYVSGGFRKGLLFLSNRPKPNLTVPAEVNELPTGPMNVYFYNTVTDNPELIRCSNATKGTATQPIQYGSDNFAYLYDSSGIRNQYVVVFGRDSRNMDSAYSLPITNYPQSILSHQYNPISNKVATVVQEGSTFGVYMRDLQIPGVNAEAKIPSRTTLSQSGGAIRSSIGNAASGDKKIGEMDMSPVKSGNTFQTEFSDTGSVVGQTTTETTYSRRMEGVDTTLLLNPFIKDSTYVKLKAQPYRLSFKPDFFTARVDNTILFSRYQSAKYNGGQYSNPPLSGLITVSLNDVLENQRFTGGIRLPINLQGSAYFLQYENFERRWDWGLLFLRTENLQNINVVYVDPVSGKPIFPRPNLQTAKVSMNLFQGSASYAFDRIRRVGFQLGLRQDVLDWKSRDTLSLLYSPRERTYWAVSRAEYVFDNSVSPTLNIRQGFRYKFFAEGIAGLNAGNGAMYNLGVDFRYYKKIYRYLTLANRLAGAHSGGKQKILYFLGGVDNWIAPKYSSYTAIDPGQNYAFQTLATNLRGYEQNARNGNTYAVLNEEIRFPIFQTILHRPVQSSVLKNMQLVGFLDVGSAWNGLIPNAQSLDKYFYIPGTANTPTLYVNQAIANGVGVGYGAGLRTMLFGYFTRVDAAWNIDGRRKPIIYVSFGTDF
jgi:hypothetical protein